ncbi:helix-turn-helix transcriptional regulator [Agrobacterium rhizogenes]|nr:helix-turn-helix transcriptional regulator [Rhizobium rhizogenes]NTH66703.1 helix-turn-helix transcriptional regulator [Rhizobium rhizogenes]
MLTAPANLALVMLTSQPNREIALNSSRNAVGLAPVGSVEIVPEGAELFARWVVDKENLLVAIDEKRLAVIAGMEFQNEDFELRPPRIGSVDRKALLLANLMREEFQRGDAMNELCFDGLITLFAVHLLRAYSSRGDQNDRLIVGGLSPKAWRAVSDYIQDNLPMRLSVIELAGIAGLSPSHFLRAFRQTSGLAPHQYLLARRLALAERLVMTTDLPFAAVAQSAGFSSNSHMTAIMKRTRGFTPMDLRRELRR